VSDTIFYFGSVVIIVFFVGLLVKKFKEDDEIDLEKHKCIIVTYIILMVMAILSWRILNLMIEEQMLQLSNYNKAMEIINNEK
jgi:NADH:ubiquinone oxidoreductase subunit 6 (subunit J)